MDAAAYISLKELQDDHWWFVSRRKVIHELIKQHARLAGNAKILEAGCGYGGNLSLLAEFGEVSAFEFDEGARRFAQKASGIDIMSGSLPDGVQFDDTRFDLIAMLDVLEHIDDDISSLQRIGEALTENGRLLITVPAFQWLWSPHDDLHHHKRRYSRKQLEERIKNAGLRSVAIGYFNSLLFPLAVAQRFLSRLSNKAPNPETIPPVLINSALCKIFSFERHWIGKSSFPFGLSLFAVAERA